MNFILCSVSFLIIISKFLDCYTTSIQIRSIAQKKNPIAVKIMQKLGIQSTIWLIFILSILIVLISQSLLIFYFDSTIYKITYILLGLFISLVQFAVSHTNSTKRLNYITNSIQKVGKNNLFRSL